MSAALQVLSFLDAPVVTGPARGLIHLGRQLPPSVRLHVAILRGRGAGPIPRLDDLAGGGLTVHELPELGAFDPTLFARAVLLARRIGAGVVQSHSYKPHVLALAVRAATGAPWIGHHHGWTAENDKVRLYHRVDGFTMPRAERVVAVAESARDIVVREGVSAGRVVVIPNAVDAADLRADETRDAARAALGLPLGRTVACVVGRLSHEKGQDVALRALAQVRDAGADLVLAFAGDGPDREALVALTRTLDLDDRVVFLGHQKRVGLVYRASDLLVMPSRSEAMPNALLEAMTVSLPVVATRVGGVPEVADDGAHILIVPPDDPVALADAVLDCLTDPAAADRRAVRALQRAIDRHDPRRRAERYVDLYESVLARRLGPWRDAQGATS
jgi:glycosyltransferase involved in cell wall biosynthesis